MDTMSLVWFILAPTILGCAAFLLALRDSRAFDRLHRGRFGERSRDVERKPS